MKPIFNRYLKDLTQSYLRDDAREESFYPALAQLVDEIAHASGRSHVQVTVQPRPTEGGNPDFRIWNGRDRVIGYIEAKKPGLSSLESQFDSEQLKRYRATFPNLILTNFLEFYLFRDGQLIDQAQLARPFVLTQLRTQPPLEGSDQLSGLLEHFLDYSLPQVLDAERLAIELARRTRFLSDITSQQLELELEGQSGDLFAFYQAFQQYLIGSLTPADFADLYAQTVTYGLFAARTRLENAVQRGPSGGSGFNRRAAFYNIPHTIGILRSLFRFISLGDLPEELEWIVDDISEVLAIADVAGILRSYYRDGRGSDPIVHFYETFLAKYDPQTRERRGVYYTPEPVVSYIVRSLHALLKSRFEQADGLAGEGVTLLDPAAGTMTFIARAALEAVTEFERKYGPGAREAFIRKHVLKDFYAFELMMAPYAVGHLKMSFFLEELGHRLEDDERAPFFLTNTLDMSELEASALPGLSALAEESRLAGRVKTQQPILVILGNPPYSGHSPNKGEWIRRQIEAYKVVDGQPLGEKNPKWLQDDYVKFLRFSQWKIEQAGRGMVGMITNHSYLDNPTFRGMRQSLMDTFDQIFVLDLHGNSLKRETSPDGSPDENVFDIRQGVAVVFLVKMGEKDKPPAEVRQADLWGTRKEKYEWLEGNDFSSTPWQQVAPMPNFYLYVPRDEAEQERYNTFTSVTDIFQKYSVGIVTARDRLSIHWTPEEVWNTVLNFSRLEPELAREAYQLGKDTRDWKVALAQEDLRRSGPDRDKVVPILYRPFDVRYTYYTGRSRGFICRPRPEIMRHLVNKDNVALISARSNKSPTLDHFFCSNTIVEAKCGESTVQSYTFPLNIYQVETRQDLFSELEPHGSQPNFDEHLISNLKNVFGIEPTPEELFHYIYAVLYAPYYREKYVDFLRGDFPRIPFPSNRDLFQELARSGARLADLHLLRSPELDVPLARFHGQGDNRVGKNVGEGFYYDPPTERLHINPEQYFAPLPLETWEYQIGGYQVCAKWLKDRRGRNLSLDEVRNYCRIATALQLTIAIQEEIDGLYPRVEEEYLEKLI